MSFIIVAWVYENRIISLTHAGIAENLISKNVTTSMVPEISPEMALSPLSDILSQLWPVAIIESKFAV